MDKNKHPHDKPDEQSKKDENVPKAYWMTARYIVGACLGLVITIGVLIIASRWLNTAISDRVQFVTANLLNVLIFAAIIAQVLIYRNQRDIMAVQRTVMLAGLKGTDRAFRLVNRASVSVHSIEMNKATRRFWLRLKTLAICPPTT